MSTGPPDISVVVATYRRERTLVETLGDLFAQQDVCLEVIVIDQTPTHEPATNEFLQRNLSRLVYVRTSEANLPKARNEGVSRARGRLVFFVDDDVRVPPDTLRRVLQHFESREVDGLAPLVLVDSIIPPGADVERRYGFTGKWRAVDRLRVDSVVGACMALRREAILDVGGFDSVMGELNRSASGEDDEFCRRFTRSGRQIWIAPTIHVYHQNFPSGGCRSDATPDPKRSQLRAMIYTILKEERAFERLTARAAARLLRASVVRRDVLSGGWREVSLALRNVAETLADVRSFWSERRRAEALAPYPGRKRPPALN